MRRFLLVLTAVAVSAMAFAGTHKVTQTTPAASVPKYWMKQENPKYVKHIEPSVRPQAIASTMQREAAQEAVVHIKALEPEGYKFQGFAVFLNENGSAMANFEMDWDTWEYETEGYFSLPAGTYDVAMLWNRTDEMVSGSYVIKEKMEVTDGMDIEFDPTEATICITSEVTNPDGKPISCGITTEDGTVIEEQTVTIYSSEWGFLPTYYPFILSAMGLMCFDSMLPAEFEGYGKVYVNELSDRYRPYALIQGTNDEVAYNVIALGTPGVSADVTVTNEGQAFVEIPVDFATSAYAIEEPFTKPWRMSPFYAFIGGYTFGGTSLGGEFSKALVSTPVDQDLNNIAWGFCPEGADACAYEDWGDGQPHPSRVAMMAQPCFITSDGLKTINTQMYNEDYCYLSPDGKPSGLYYTESTLNFDNTLAQVQLGNTTPYISVGNAQMDYGELYNSYWPRMFGRLTESRTDVDICKSTLEFKIDGNLVCDNFNDMMMWTYSTDCNQYANSTFDYKVRDENCLIDGIMPTYAQARVHTDWSTGDRTAPVLQRVVTMKMDGTITDRFDTPNEGALLIMSGDYNYISDPETWTGYFDAKPAAKVEVKYAPHGSIEWTDLTVIGDDEFDMPSFGDANIVLLYSLSRLSGDGWFDLAVILTDEAGNYCEEIISPCFNVASLVGIDSVKGTSMATVKGVKGAIVVAGAEGARAEVFSTSGCKVADSTASRIPVQPGVYVVRVNGETYKVAVR